MTCVMENDKRSETIEKLKKAGKEEFLKNGYQRASLRRICNSAGVTTGAFYFSFESKEALFKAILEPLVSQYEAMLGKLMKGEIQNPGTGVDADKIMMQFLLTHAPVAVMCLCEAAAYCKSQGITLWDHMLDLYEKYGYYKEGLYTITLKGVTGAEKIRRIMSSLRSESITQIDTLKVLKVRDYEKNTITDLATGVVTESGLPQSNVLYYDLEDGAWACVRPSGTEPKIKLYYGIKGTSLEDADAKLESLQAALVEKLNKLAE